MIWLYIGLALLADAALACAVGWWLGRRFAVAEYDDRLERIESSRTPGQPTNTGVPFSRVTQGRMRRRMYQDGDAHER